MYIRKYEDGDAAELSGIVRRNFLEVNIRDYPAEAMARLAMDYSADKIRSIAALAHMYVACDKAKSVGCGSIASFWGSVTESILLTIFVLPEYHGRGVGRMIVQALEQDELFVRASRIEIPASITACGFYEKMGYVYKDGLKEIDAEGHYRMEKRQ